VQAWIASAGLASASLKRYMATFRLVLDFAGVELNPARDRRVKLPRVVDEEPEPPSASDFLAILERVPRRTALPLAVIEQAAMRTQDVLALTWGDVDVAGARFSLPRQRTKTHRPRWIQVPEWLMELVAATCPAEDRTPERRVFQGLSEKTLYHAVGGACRAAEIAHYHPPIYVTAASRSGTDRGFRRRRSRSDQGMLGYYREMPSRYVIFRCAPAARSQPQTLDAHLSTQQAGRCRMSRHWR
jgi:integrase